jgi:hypothetical protein
MSLGLDTPELVVLGVLAVLLFARPLVRLMATRRG